MKHLPIGDAVFRVREARGLTHLQLATLTGVHRNTILRIEKGYPNPSLQILIQLAGGLDLDLSRLLKYAETLAPRIVQEVVNP